jgi:CheY-like chemotaxis protein
MPESSPRVLLVDDYPDALDVWELYLRAEGFTVLTAANGHDALEGATSAVPEMIVMDLQLPDLSGFEVARELRSRPATRHIPMIAATGYSHAVHLEEARRSGFDSLIVKPCDPDELVTEIRRLLTGAAGTRAASTGH